jgi:hypothetical protein
VPSSACSGCAATSPAYNLNAASGPLRMTVESSGLSRFAVAWVHRRQRLSALEGRDASRWKMPRHAGHFGAGVFQRASIHFARSSNDPSADVDADPKLI